MKSEKHFGLIGKTLKHSFSAKYFTEKFHKEEIQDTYYGLYELESITDFPQLIKSKQFSGLNVTIPYKEQVIPYLDSLDQTAKEIGAVNTIQIQNGKLKGFNTDVVGFQKSLKLLIGRKKVEKAFVLGTGGASKAILYCLAKMGIKTTIVSRKEGYIHYDEIDREMAKSHRLWVNCTPLGTYPDIESSAPMPYKYLNKKHLLFDLVYNPEKTVFLEHAVRKNCSVMNGSSMLVGQAEASWEIWNTP